MLQSGLQLHLHQQPLLARSLVLLQRVQRVRLPLTFRPIFPVPILIFRWALFNYQETPQELRGGGHCGDLCYSLY